MVDEDGRRNGGSCTPTTAGSTTIAVMESRAHKLGIGIAPGVALTTATRFNTCTHCKVDWDDASQSSSRYPEEGHPALQGEAKQGHTKMKQITELSTSHQTTKKRTKFQAWRVKMPRYRHGFSTCCKQKKEKLNDEI